MKDFEPVGDGLEMLFGSFCFQVGQTGTLRLPERVPPPSIRTALWVPPISVLRTSTLIDESDDSNSCNSDLCGPPSDEGTYGSGSERCGSSDPIRGRYQCTVVIQGESKLPPGSSTHIPPPNPPPTCRLETEETLPSS